MTWQPTMVTTIDGRRVPSDSSEWMACCEAVHTLGKSEVDRSAWLVEVERKRGMAGRRSLEAEMDRVEPAYLLALGDRDARRAYLAQAERYRGEHVRKHLEQRIVALWEQRKAETAANGGEAKC